MRKCLVLILFALVSKAAHSQVGDKEISITFDNISRAEAFEQINSSSDFKIFYLKDWFTDSLIQKSFVRKDIGFILDDLLEGTTVNYFLYLPDKVILTNNNTIYGKLPEGFFGKDTTEVEKVTASQKVAPIFYGNQDKVVAKSMETIRVGRETGTRSKDTYILSGNITNFESGDPIPDMTISTENNQLLAVTSFEGFYRIELPAGSNILKFRALGIERSEKEIIVFNDGTLDLVFEESVEQLDEVVVQGDIYKNIEETVSGTEEIDSEESKTIPLVLGERDVLKVATALPGISSAGEGATGFNVRGGKADQNLVLFDGATLYNPQHFFGIFSAINPFSIGQLEVYKGNIPAKFGGRLSSVFDIKTKDGDNTEFKGEASLGPVTGNLVMETPIVKGKSSLMFGARGAYANWILRSMKEQSLSKSRASFYDGIINYTHQVNENNRVKATAYYSKDNFSISSDSLYIYDNRLVSLRWQHRFNDKHLSEVQLANSSYTFNIEYERGANNDFDLGYKINETEARINMDYLHSTDLRFNYGVEGKLYAVEPGTLEPLNDGSSIEYNSLEKERALEAAAYLSANYNITKKLAVDLGMRYSTFMALGEQTQYEYEEGAPKNQGSVRDTIQYGNNEVIETYGGPEIRAGARYLITPSLSLKAGYNRSIQYVHILTNNTTISPIDTWKLSDLNIEPQKGHQYSFGIFKNLDADAYEISLEGFYKTSNKVLDFKTGAQLLMNENVETEVLQGEGKSYGVEFLIRKNRGKLNGWLGYTYSRSFLKLDSEFEEERVNNGDFFASNFDKPHDLSMVANYKFTRRFSLSANFVYQTGRPVTVPVGNFTFNDAEYAVYSDRNSYRIPDFYRLDLGFNIEGNHKLNKVGHSFWTISVYNVLGRNNPYSVFYTTENGDVKAYKSSIFSIPVPSITYNFKF
ncbi:TonB-dependent receptor [Flagellimonas okinawensis]|uniref:TonB-dependent receptor n=1 Tax=Flagellimonas okinawensis TaxID=3031324 RepID=A0ABT5XPU9_9FLAO|nr:TonB-dependent receptor [[Muricauda] okinawensis]MDF0707840.1 TonB-dependent receptor [[Muricauda] okinawensis]